MDGSWPSRTENHESTIVRVPCRRSSGSSDDEVRGRSSRRTNLDQRASFPLPQLAARGVHVRAFGDGEHAHHPPSAAVAQAQPSPDDHLPPGDAPGPRARPRHVARGAVPRPGAALGGRVSSRRRVGGCARRWPRRRRRGRARRSLRARGGARGCSSPAPREPRASRGRAGRLRARARGDGREDRRDEGWFQVGASGRGGPRGVAAGRRA